MIKTIKAILAPAVIAASLLSCKKDNSGNTEPTLLKNEATKVEAWFNSQPNISAAKLPAATPLYANTVSYAGSGINITPLQLAGSTASQVAGKFLVTGIDAAGNITGGNFYIVLNKTNLSLTNFVTPDFLLLKQIPENFTGGIIKYDMGGNMLSSVHIQAGKVMTRQQDILSNTKLKPAGGSTANLAPPPSGQTCTDWYYQHFENGILIWEEYLFTSCEDTSGQGGGGNGQPTTQQLDALFDGYVAGSHPTSIKISEITLTNGSINRTKKYDWQFHQINNGFGPVYKFYSSEIGVQTRDAGGVWHFTSLTHQSDWQEGAANFWDVSYVITDHTAILGQGIGSMYASMHLLYNMHIKYDIGVYNRTDDGHFPAGATWSSDQGIVVE